MATGSHIAFHRFTRFDVDDGREEEGFAVLATEVAGDDVVEVCEVGFAGLKEG
jgi:hypothetical protein